MKIMILFPKLLKGKGVKARKAIQVGDAVKKQVSKDAKKSAKAVTKKKKPTTKKKGK